MSKIPLDDPRKRVTPGRVVKRRIINELDSNGWIVARHIVKRETNLFFVTIRRELDIEGREIQGRVKEDWLLKSDFPVERSVEAAAKVVEDAQNKEGT